MATNFPTSLDSLTNPTSSDSLSSPSHSAQHANANDAIEALQAKVGADSSAVTSSLDYKVAQLEAISHGKILQVVQATYGTAESTTSDSYVDTSLNASITPSATSSKVLIFCNVSWRSSRTQVSSGYVYHAIERGGGQIWEQLSGSYYMSTDSVPLRQVYGNSTLTYLDSPATTSATTYTLQHKKGATGTTATSFFQDIPASLILIEVSA